MTLNRAAVGLTLNLDSFNIVSELKSPEKELLAEHGIYRVEIYNLINFSRSTLKRG